MRDKLVRPLIFLYDICLPHKELIDEAAAELVKLRRKRPIDRAAHIREVLPAIDAVAPVIKAELFIQRLDVVMEFISQVTDEGLLHIRARRVVILRLVVELIADYAFSAGRHRKKLPDQPLRVEAVGRTRDIHDLPRAVDARALVRHR